MKAACLATLLSGCATFSSTNPLPPVPLDLAVCAAEAGIPVPEADLPNGSLSNAATAAFVAELLASERAALRCAKDIVAWYSDLRAAQTGA